MTPPTVEQEERRPRSTKELLAPEPRDIAEDGGRCHWWSRRRHCWHSIDAKSLIKQRRRCCHCADTQRSDLRAAGHGPHVPDCENLVMIWTPWTTEHFAGGY